ncbi:MAG: hypothetical protein V6Z89_01435 [Desulfobacter sp.]
MMDKDKLRKADLFSGGAIVLAGLFIVSQALKMPMKDSWGGVQNVWYVSPAVFPLFVGCTIVLLGLLLVRTALKHTGSRALADTARFFTGPAFREFLTRPSNIRFYAILVLLVSFVFIMIPRIDFFPAAVFFLVAFISMFYPDDDGLLKPLLLFYLGQTGVLVLCMATGLLERLSGAVPYPGDILVLVYIPMFAWFARSRIRALGSGEQMRKFHTGLAVALIAPIAVGMAFKYLLLVPMPFEGMVVALMDAVWYFEF